MSLVGDIENNRHRKMQLVSGEIISKRRQYHEEDFDYHRSIPDDLYYSSSGRI